MAKRRKKAVRALAVLLLAGLAAQPLLVGKFGEPYPLVKLPEFPARKHWHRADELRMVACTAVVRTADGRATPTPLPTLLADVPREQHRPLASKAFRLAPRDGAAPSAEALPLPASAELRRWLRARAAAAAGGEPTEVEFVWRTRVFASAAGQLATARPDAVERFRLDLRTEGPR